MKTNIRQSPAAGFIELAIEIERNGYRFYELAAQGRGKEAKGVLMQLAGRERQHEHTFRDMLALVGGYTPSDACGDFKYIKMLADSSIFAGGPQAVALLGKKTLTDVEVAEAGIQAEKDSILLYSEARDMLPPQDRDIIDMITAEEKKHFSELMYLANKLRGR